MRFGPATRRSLVQIQSPLPILVLHPTVAELVDTVVCQTTGLCSMEVRIPPLQIGEMMRGEEALKKLRQLGFNQRG